MINKEVIEKLYIRENLKISEVAEKLNSSVYFVTKALKKYNIKTRNIGYYNKHPRIDFSKDQYDFFDGLMASDGSLVIVKSDGRIRNAKISCAFKHKEFAEYINICLNLNGNIHEKSHKSSRYKNGSCTQYGLFSQNNILFTEEHKRWYPNGKKVLPLDFRFSPASMNIFYLGDGHLASSRGIILSTQSFNSDRVEELIVKPLENIGINCNMNKNGEIYILKGSVKDFLEYIGTCSVNCYEYKWDL